jgi:hypothetical protein
LKTLKPLVSVLLPTHARYRNGFLAKSVQSVLDQDYDNFEFFIVDDGSVDGSADYLAELAKKDARVQHIRHDINVGLPALTLFQAYLKTKGEFIAFNFDDTVLTPDCFTRLVDTLVSKPDVGMAYGQMVMHMPDGEITYGQEPDAEELLKFNYIGNSSVMLRRSAIESVGWYDPHILLKRSCDLDLWLRFLKKAQVAYIPQVLSHEYGQNLTDSFRRAYYSFDDLRDRYMATDRTASLVPSAMQAGEPNLVDVSLPLTEEERRQVSLSCIEHFVRILDFAGTAAYAEKLLAQGDPAITLLWNRIQLRDAGETDKTDKTALLTQLGTIYYYSQKLDIAQNKLHEHESDLHEVRAELGDYKDKYHALLRSLSWRLTKPLRETMAQLTRRSKETNV